MGLGKVTNYLFIHSNLYQTNQQCWTSFGAKKSHGWPQIHKTHHGLDSREATTFPHIVFCTFLWSLHLNGFLSRDSQRRVSKLLRLELAQLCEAIIMRSNLRSGWGFKQSCNSRWELSNSVSHATCTHRVRVDSRLFVVGSQTSTPRFSFCHNLCFRCPNGSYKLILEIYTSIAFQWYKKIFNAMCFDLYNHSLKVRESTGTLTPKMGAHLGVWVFIFTFSHTSPGSCPCNLFFLDRKCKARVMTQVLCHQNFKYVNIVHISSSGE
jgi:hypothetical protein